MTNEGSTPLEDLTSGYIVWPDGGSLFGVPGLAGEYSGFEDTAMARWSAAYGDNWVLGLHAPFSQFVDYGGRDRYRSHTLQPGETRQFEAWLQIEPAADLPRSCIPKFSGSSWRLGGCPAVLQDVSGNDVAQPAVVFSKNGKPYSWVTGSDGRYECRLPAGDYQAYATAPGHAQGATQVGPGRERKRYHARFFRHQTTGHFAKSRYPTRVPKRLSMRVSASGKATANSSATSDATLFLPNSTNRVRR